MIKIYVSGNPEIFFSSFKCKYVSCCDNPPFQNLPCLQLWELLKFFLYPKSVTLLLTFEILIKFYQIHLIKILLKQLLSRCFSCALISNILTGIQIFYLSINNSSYFCFMIKSIF